MNETYEWLYDHYALPLVQIRDQVTAIHQEILFYAEKSAHLYLRDRLEDLCQIWGTEMFSLGLQLGLRLIAGQRGDTLMF